MGIITPARMNHTPLRLNPFFPFKINIPEIVTKIRITIIASLNHFQERCVATLCSIFISKNTARFLRYCSSPFPVAGSRITSPLWIKILRFPLFVTKPLLYTTKSSMPSITCRSALSLKGGPGGRSTWTSMVTILKSGLKSLRWFKSMPEIAYMRVMPTIKYPKSRCKIRSHFLQFI